MASLESLPTELLLSIVEHLQPSVQDIPIVGENACWKNASVFYPPWRRENWGISNETYKGTARYAPLMAMRQTNRFFNEACIPYIFQEINLLTQMSNYLEIPLLHAQYIRTARILVDPDLGQGLTSYQTSVGDALSMCKNLVSLGLYYRIASSSWGSILPATISLLERRTVRSLGIYSIVVVQKIAGSWDWNYINPTNAITLLDVVASNCEIATSIRRLDIACETMPQRTYDLLRSHFTQLESLSIRRALRVWAFDDRELGRLWDPCQAQKWMPYQHLTTLNLIDCSNAYAPHIPELVRLFHSLRSLIISTCGYSTDVPLRPVFDWYTQPNALWKTHRPLDLLHLEHMLDWENLVLGVIPTTKLVTSTIRSGHLGRAFRQDSQIYLGLQELNVEEYMPGTESDGDSDGEKEQTFLEKVCKERSICFKKDAQWIKRNRRNHFAM